MRCLLLVVLAAAFAVPATATAAEPIMSLGEVHAGARCTGLSVVHATTISAFAVEILDVINRERPESARILIRVSGSAVAATGLGPGFSGSPIYCPDAAGLQRNIGAISAGVGEYGGAVGLATPIERILAAPVLAPSSASKPLAPAPVVVGSHSLAGPLTLSGVSPAVATMFARASRKAGHPLLTSVASGGVGYPPQPLVPGAAVSVGLTSGDVGIGSIGTVAYADGADVWLFGHSLDGAGRRSLFLEDAYIQTVINNPIGAPELSTYKLGSPGNDVGTVTNDTIDAVAGRLGALPPHYPLRVTARDLDTGKLRSVNTLVADEGDVGDPAGPSLLGLAAAAAVADAASTVLGGAPARQSGEMCVAITLRELKGPTRFCQRYAVDAPGPNPLSGTLGADIADAAAIIDGYEFGVLHPTNVEVGLRLSRGLRQAYLQEAAGPRRARRGSTIKLRLKLRRTGTGVRFTRTIRLRIPHGLRPGSRTIKLTGTDADAGTDPSAEELAAIFEEGGGGATEQPPPDDVAGVRDQIEDLERYDGVTATIGGREIKAYRDPALRISGDARVELKIQR